MLQCRQLVAVCDEILESSPSEVLNNTVQLESVDLVPASPADHLVTRPHCSPLGLATVVLHRCFNLLVLNCGWLQSYCNVFKPHRSDF